MKEPFVAGRYYHVFNRGNDGIDLFKSEDDYNHFLELYLIYANPFLETLSWCLMKNHYHFCVRIKRFEEIGCFDKRSRWANDLSDKWRLFQRNDIPEEYQISPNPLRMLNFMFDAYSKYFNFKYKRTGVLFERGIERRLVENNDYLIELILYIHNNPVKHRITPTPDLYYWSSYNEILKGSSVFCNSRQIIKLFDSEENFIYAHKAKFSDDSAWSDY
ncbi:MAG: hypothetical protein A2W93_06630 [Bacteroidetes bacterium GWF2_43_63]|nr:MAG: hypothetical protein A2W94_07905 [Bacteroidetes bacterium GWE2_42_42]OFY53295.1 MAG: hypothetical protein A2W93_06630 [Bacteroidetes bacterium GWF2_43_63]HBG71711.1 hypothetical protein [Bacteroidales bacterium]HCB61624.1 hypothetical protein [Bacteroidales bacterium]HCY22836.1 hypothetical protein [Bacteroidales bacterium]